MPKVNVYLPDRLADAVKDAGIPVSAVCQHALEEAVGRTAAVRTALRKAPEDLAAGAALFTERARTVVRLAAQKADAGPLGTAHLLTGMIEEGDNLALRVMDSLDITTDRLARELSAHPVDEAAGPDSPHFTAPAARALENMVTESVSLGHGYVGCEHLLIGLVAEQEGAAGRILRDLEVDPRLVRRSVKAALAGLAHTRGAASPGAADPHVAVAAAVRREVEPLITRIEHLEHRLAD